MPLRDIDELRVWMEREPPSIAAQRIARHFIAAIGDECGDRQVPPWRPCRTSPSSRARGSSPSLMSRYRDVMTKQTTVRLPDDLADDAEAVARVRGDSVNQLIIDSLAAEIERVRADDDFVARVKQLLERDREILDRLAK